MQPVPERATAGDITQIWAEQEFTRLGILEAPEYGTPEWVKLPPRAPERFAAVIEAAELWRRHCAREAWLDQLAEEDPEQWYALAMEDARAEGAKVAKALRGRRALKDARASFRPAHQLKATPGWGRIAIPGKPGEYLTYGQETPA
jgi:hypothetical protein